MACEVTTLSFAQGIKSYWNTKLIEIKFFCRRLKNAQIAVFEEGMNSKSGIKMEIVKKANPKMRSTLLKKCHTGIRECGTYKIGENYFIANFKLFYSMFSRIIFFWFNQKISLKYWKNKN